MRLAVAAALCVLSLPSFAQEWDYLSYSSITGRAASPGYLKLTESSPGQFKVRLMFPGADFCYASDLAATVSDEPSQKIIVAAARMGGCPEIRFVLKADGLGGRREVRGADGAWVSDGVDRGLRKRP